MTRTMIGRCWVRWLTTTAGRLAAAAMLLAAVLVRAADIVPVSEIPTSSLPLITIRAFLEGARGWGEKQTVRVRGTVTHVISDKTFFIQEGDAGTYVFHKPAVPHRVGEMVEVVGLPSLGGFSPTLHYCDTRLVGDGKAVTPVRTTPAEALSGSCNMRLVTLRGYLAADRLRAGRVLILNSGDAGQTFTADLEAELQMDRFDDLLPGSLLELTGVCSVRRNPEGKVGSFNLFVRSRDDIRVVEPPSWWTLKRTMTVLGVVGVGLLLALAWIGTLRREVRRQTASVRRLNEELELRVRERTRELESANREMEAFNYSVSHDLRTPLRYIAGFVDLARDESSDRTNPSLQKYLQRISEAADQMGRLIDALLALSRMSKQPIARRSVQLSGLVRSVIQSLEPDMAGREVEWKIAPLPEVQADADMVRVVWTNLISNALKYTHPRSRAVIEIDSKKTGDEVAFFIRDNGVGFDSRYARRLFEVFQRLHSDDQFEGTGVGLATVRRIVERHGGRIWAESAAGEGATFFFTLPPGMTAHAPEPNANR